MDFGNVDMVRFPFILAVAFFFSKKSRRRLACLCFFSLAISSAEKPALDKAPLTDNVLSVTRSEAAISILGDPFGAIVSLEVKC